MKSTPKDRSLEKVVSVPLNRCVVHTIQFTERRDRCAIGYVPYGAIPVATVQESKDMETIVREINRSYASIEKGEKEGFDGCVFAEDHIHSVLETVTNKDVHTALNEAVRHSDSHSSTV